MPVASFIKQHVPLHLHRYGEFHVHEDSALYITHTIRTIAVNLVGIFLPLYIFTISHAYLYFSDDKIINGIVWVLGYFLLRSVGVLLTIATIGSAIFSKILFQRSILLSCIALIAEICLWFLAKQNIYLILVSGLIAGIQLTLYWVPYHIFFIRKIKTVAGHYGKQTSLRFFFVRLTSGVTPFIGGVIIATFGFSALFVISILLVLVSVLPIMSSVHEEKHTHTHDLKKILRKFYFNKKYKLMTLSYLGDGADAIIYAIFWPILLFTVLDDFVKVGFINALSLTASAVSVLWVGKLLDKKGSKLIHGIGVVFNSLLYIPRMLFSSVGLFYAIDVVDRINSSFYALPNMSLAYEKAKRSGDDGNFTVYRELVIHTSIIVVCSLVIVLVLFLGVWKWVFIIAMIGSLMTYLMDFDKN